MLIDNSEVRQLSQGASHAISLGYKSDLQEKRGELIKDGILRFRLRLNMYKYKDISQQQAQNNENERISAKRRKIENMVTFELSLLPIVETLWNTRDKAGDITIVCDEQELKAHQCILSGINA